VSKLTDIIRREVKDLVSKQGGLMVTPAVITAVQEDYLRADVKLLGNGAEIKGMLNKSPGKLTVGQTVTVAYETLPSSGVILIANGETDPLSEGGGWEVENAVLYDAANLHEYTVDTELMTDISANTKLYYGADNRMIVAQGVPVYLGSFTASDFTAKLDSLLTANSAYISPEYTGLISYRYNSGVVYKYEVDIKVYPYQVNAESNNRWRWWWMTRTTIKTTNMSTSAVTTNTYLQTHDNFYTTNFNDISEYGLLLTTPTFGVNSPDALLDSYITNGYVGSNTNINASSTPTGSTHVRGLIVFKNASQDAWNVNYQGTVSLSYNTRVGAYMPLTAAETCFALGTTQRSEPVTPGGGS
jgi:hypothetical protein